MSSPAKLAPSTEAVPARVKAREGTDLFRDYLRRLRRPMNFDVLGDLERFDALLREHAGRSLREAAVFEIGYGPRPYRLLALRAMGVDVRGVDAEVPVLSGRPAELRDAYATNGAERLAKSLVRRALFDWRENRAFRRALRAAGLAMPRVERERLIVADATKLDLPPASLDLVYSEDVFEHLPTDGIGALLPRMAAWLKPDGLALIRPNVFTGITGGHLIEWNRRSLLTGHPRERRTGPWSHLLDDDFQTNTHLNRLTRADYRELFGEHFEILAEEVTLPDLGREFLTPAVRERLAAYGDDELFSNEVRFVLRPRSAAGGPDGG